MLVAGDKLFATAGGAGSGAGSAADSAAAAAVPAMPTLNDAEKKHYGDCAAAFERTLTEQIAAVNAAYVARVDALQKQFLQLRADTASGSKELRTEFKIAAAPVAAPAGAPAALAASAAAASSSLPTGSGQGKTGSSAGAGSAGSKVGASAAVESKTAYRDTAGGDRSDSDSDEEHEGEEAGDDSDDDASGSGSGPSSARGAAPPVDAAAERAHREHVIQKLDQQQIALLGTLCEQINKLKRYVVISYMAVIKITKVEPSPSPSFCPI